MVTVQDGVIGGLGAVAAILYLVVARLQAKRQVSPEARPAMIAFIIWWAGLGFIGLLSVYFRLGPALDEQGLLVYRLVFYPLVGLLFVVVAGLVYYLLYLYTGRTASLYVVAAFYALMFVFLVWMLEGHALHYADGAAHDGVDAGVRVHPHEQPPAWASLLLGVGLVLPPFAAAIAYGLLFFRTTDRTARFRIALVSAGFILWFGFSLLGTVGRFIAQASQQTFAGRVTGQLLGVLAAVLVLIAYDPPRWAQERFGLRRIGDTAHGSREVFEPPRRVDHADRPQTAPRAPETLGGVAWPVAP